MGALRLDFRKRSKRKNGLWKASSGGESTSAGSLFEEDKVSAESTRLEALKYQGGIKQIRSV